MITAVEENIHYLNPPVADVFRGFLAETNMISADVKQALSNMKPKLDNYVFREWVDAAIACQDDKSLKSTLTPDHRETFGYADCCGGTGLSAL